MRSIRSRSSASPVRPLARLSALSVGAAMLVGCFNNSGGGQPPTTGGNPPPTSTPATPTTSPASAPGTPNPPVAAAPTELKGHERAVTALAFSRDGTVLASASLDKTVHLWDVGTGKEKKVIPHPAGEVFGVVWTAEGKLVTTSGDGKGSGELTWWDPESGVNRKKVSVPKGMVRAVAVSPAGDKVAWIKGATVEVLPSGADDKGGPLASANEGPGDSPGLAFSADGKQLAVSTGWGAKLWDIDPPAAKAKKLSGPQDPTGVAFDPKGNVLVASDRQVISVLDPTTGNLIENVHGMGTAAVGVAVTADGKYILSGVGNGVRFYDPKTHEEVGRLTVPDPKFAANCVAVSPDGTRVAVGGGY